MASTLRFSTALLAVSLVLACDTGGPVEDSDRSIADGDSENTASEAVESDDALPEDDAPPADFPEDFAGEPCEQPAIETRECGTDVEGELLAGVQYCAVDFSQSSEQEGPTMIWGECLVEPECTPDGSGCDEFSGPVCEVGLDGVPRRQECEWDDDDNTPLVLAFGDAPIEYQPMPMAADFDINGAGRCTAHDWPTAATPWLAIDLNKDGVIEGGHELFGSGTQLSSGGTASDGFAALAELDDNGDGRVSEDDARWSELVLWSDLNRDKRSDAGELEPLSAYGVSVLPITYVRDRQCDGRRNCAVEQASFEFASGASTAVGRVVDVHLACR